MNTAQKQHYPALDGLRGVAILLVLLYHNFRFVEHFFFGWLGVDLFFVLSGFLITTILIDTVNKPNYFKNFYMRRVLRIFPLYYSVLIIFLIILPSLHIYQERLAYFVKNQWWFWLYAENWLMSFNFPPGNSNFLNHFWSLAVEEQFYLVWPPIVFLIRKPKALFWVMMALLLVAIGSRYYIWSQQIADLNYTTLYTFTRIDGICVGALVALLRKIDSGFLKRNLSYIVLSVAALNFAFYFLNQPYGVLPYLAIAGYTTFAFLFGVLVNEIVTSDKGLFNSVLTIKPLMYIGKISYGFYVFHWPVYAIISDLLGNKIIEGMGDGFLAQLTIALIATTIAFVISVLSFHFFESKFLRLKKYFA